MKKRRILSVAVMFGLLVIVYGADQENADIFQAQSTEGNLAEEDTEEEIGDRQDAERPERKNGLGQVEVEDKGEAEAQSEVLEGYAVFLTEYALQGKGSGNEETAEWTPAFALIYLDGDDVPELVMSGGYEYPWGVSVYTFIEGKTIFIGTYGQNAELHYREKEGILFDDHERFGNLYSDVYQIEGGRRTLLQSLNEGECLPGYESAAEKGERQYTYTVDGEEVSEEEYRAAYDKWNEPKYKVISYDMCRKITDGDIRKHLMQELETLVLSKEEALKQDVLTAAEAQEDAVLLWDYDDYDGDGKYEAFTLCGNTYDDFGVEKYKGTLYFEGADGSVSALSDRPVLYRMIDGKMDFGPIKHLFFYLDYNFTANISEIWVDAYDHFCEKNGFEDGSDMWTGHTWKPYFYHYNEGENRLEAYAGEEITAEMFQELSGTNIIEEIEADGHTVGEIIHWGNDIVTINYHYMDLFW